MSFPLQNTKTFNYYRRYKWTAVDFTTLQDTLLNFPATLLAELFGDAVLKGGNQNGSTGLSVDFLEVYGVNSLGNLLYSAAGSVSVTDNIKSLIVLRPVTTATTPITRPTAPFDAVFLNSEITAEVVAIDGTISAYPSKAAGDVILFGVVASGGSITLIDESLCELAGKSTELAKLARENILVGNKRECHYRLLSDYVVDQASGDRVRVLDSQTLTAGLTFSVNDLNVEFDPGVVFTGGAFTGFTLSGNGIKLKEGRFTGFTTAVLITGNYCTLLCNRFASNTTDVTDTPATSQQVGVLSE